MARLVRTFAAFALGVRFTGVKLKKVLYKVKPWR